VPIPKEEWYIDMHAYFGGKSFDGLKGYLYQRPIWMEFKYDVSIVSKSYNEYMALQDYFMQNFVYGKRFIFNEFAIGEDIIGDIVPYIVRDTDVPRTDGVFETNYEFTCSVWLYPRKPEEVELIQRVVINLERNDEALYGIPAEPWKEAEEVVIVEKEKQVPPDEFRKVVEATDDITLSEEPLFNKSIDVICLNKSDKSIIVSVEGNFKTPDSQEISIVVPVGGYAEVNFLNVAGVIYARGA
jgi:hypothetical protein